MKSQWRRVPLSVWLGAGLLLVGPEPGGAQQQSPPPSAEAAKTWKQEREWLEWNHRQVRRDVDPLAELARTLREQASRLPRDLLPSGERKSVIDVAQKAFRLQEKVEKADPHVLSLELVGLAEQVENEARTLRQSLRQEQQETRQLSSLLRQIQSRAKRVAGRLRQP